jgi:hypothetical protein
MKPNGKPLHARGFFVSSNTTKQNKTKNSASIIGGNYYLN